MRLAKDRYKDGFSDKNQLKQCLIIRIVYKSHQERGPHNLLLNTLKHGQQQTELAGEGGLGRRVSW